MEMIMHNILCSPEHPCDNINQSESMHLQESISLLGQNIINFEYLKIVMAVHEWRGMIMLV